MVPDDPLRAAYADPSPTDWLRQSLVAGGTVEAPLPGPAAAVFLAWHLTLHHTPRVVVVADSPRSLETLARDAETLRPEGARLLVFPAWESAPGAGAVGNLDLAGDRLLALHALSAATAGDRLLVITDIQALLQRTPDPGALASRRRTLAVGDTQDPAALAEALEADGYDFGHEVLGKGEAARRGGVLDVWPPDASEPLRLEFFGDTIDSIRSFDPEHQRSTARLATLTLGPAHEGLRSGAAPEADFTAYLPPRAAWVWPDPEAAWRHAEVYLASLAEGGNEPSALSEDALRARLAACSGGGQLLAPVTAEAEAAERLGVFPLDGLPGAPQAGQGPDVMDGLRRAFVQRLRETAARGGRVQFWLNTPGACDRFREGLLGGDAPGVEVRQGVLSEGFRLPARQLWILAESDVYGVGKRLRGRYEKRARPPTGETVGERVQGVGDLIPGDLVVHLDHGVGRYLGLQRLPGADGGRREVLTVEYAAGAKLHLPVSQANLLSRYVGMGGGTPDLHHLGGRRWEKEKAAAAQAVQDLAAKLLETQARRKVQPGIAYPPDGHWQTEFENAFPWQETEDQESAIAAVKRDMESPHPMDRLVCGDVGYGKTEVAMRAAFKAVMHGKQVAMLVPTTILAQQHYASFIERMTSFPVTVDVLSRFRSRAEQQAILTRLAGGALDIVIGTHRLNQDDVRFRDLGLVIVDEEQRFGVAHKERLKDLRASVDVLTLTATPIPRTLYMSMTGARDMSVIQTAPRERLPVTTVIKPRADALIRQAILHEINRGGQVFFLHNRVGTIRFTEIQLKRLVPEARILTAHGRMDEEELEEAMRRFIAGEADVLLCTTIIESGVDIPNANTILIDRADRFGLAELYQLRGRVGRSQRRGFCYLLLPESQQMTPDARRRLRALQRHSDLGAGFKLALRDLEIRGAGNLLGAEQSGHISAVGFDLYCQLLDRTVRQLKHEPAPPVAEAAVRLDFLDLGAAVDGPQACGVPGDYIEEEARRVDVYRRIAAAATGRELDRLQEELTDRFGAPPGAVRRLLLVARLRVAASSKQIREVEVRDNKVMLSRHGQFLMVKHQFPRLVESDPERRLRELVHLVSNWKVSAASV
jgi:transcription-repair coupling factor (superfamily II helicase)